MSTLRVDNIQDQSGAERRGLKTYAMIGDIKTSGTAGGTLTSGAWRTRDLNVVFDDPDNIVSIASNQFTIGAGDYLIKWSCPAYAVSRHQSAIYNVTTGSRFRFGTSEYNEGGVSNQSFGFARVSLTGNNTFEIQHRSQTTGTSNGFGVEFGLDLYEIYTLVEIIKEA